MSNTIIKRQKLVLIVEDEYTIRETLRMALEGANYAVLTANNGLDALAILKTDVKPDLVLLDMMMPIMTGREFLDVVLADSKLAPIPVVIVSAVADDKNTKGAKGFVKKPPDLKTLLDLVSQYTTE